MGIASGLDAAIAEQEGEITRIRTQMETDVAACETRLVLLRKARAKVDDELDTIAAELMKAGLWPERPART